MCKRAAGLVLLLAVLLGLLLLWLPHSRTFWAGLFPQLAEPLYTRQSFPALVGAHLRLLAWSSLFSVVLGLGMAVAVTRPAGRAFRPLVSALATIGQTFPPAAVLALAVPALGFGFRPALFALVIYGVLPVVSNAIRALEDVPQPLLEAGQAMGMGAVRLFWHVELPSGARLMLAGVRTSVLMNVATATIGSTVGALSLGTPIVAGLVNANPAFVAQGAVLVAVLALLIDAVLNLIEACLPRSYVIG